MSPMNEQQQEGFKVIIVDYNDANQAADLSRLLNGYAQDPMGGGKPLSNYVIENLAKELAAVSGAFSVLCYKNDTAVGLINCLMSFSSFRCKPIINIHDIAVDNAIRRAGICQRMLEKVEEVARERGCAKLSLEVLEGNEPAMKAYRKFGFDGYELDPAHGRALFWEKAL